MRTPGEHPTSPSVILRSLEDLTFFFVTQLACPEAIVIDTAIAKRNVKRKQYLPNRMGSCHMMTSLRIAYLATVAHTNILEERILTKRDIYYICPQLFANPAFVDRALATLSVGLNIPRNDLNIVAAPKGIVSGCVAFVEEDGHEVNVAMFSSEGCLIPPRPERMQNVTTDACAIVVIEKEASYHSMLSEPTSQELMKTCVFVTGKGYPDFATRLFLDKLSASQQQKGIELPIYILTDADPHGINIAYCYIRDLPTCKVQWIGVQPSDNGSLFSISPASFLDITGKENALIDSMLQQISEEQRQGTSRASALVPELKALKATQKKFEMEALAVLDFGPQPSGLLRYLLDRTEDVFCG